jgi:hypothetical protein
MFQVHGKPVPVPKVDKSDKAEFEKAVDQLHDAFMIELQSLYDRWRRLSKLTVSYDAYIVFKFDSNQIHFLTFYCTCYALQTKPTINLMP